MIRVFIAVEISPGTINRIASAVANLKHKLPEVRWTAPANFQLTVKFIGDIETHRADAIADALDRIITLFPRCTINAKGLGVFPGLRQPRILWVGFIGDELTQLAERVNTALLPLGFAGETRGFAPHLTIGRWRQPDRPTANLREEIARWRDHDFGATLVDRLILFQSVLKPTGAAHSQLKVFKLNEQAD